ncbi:cystatin family protein [Vibrio sp. FJH11]
MKLKTMSACALLVLLVGCQPNSPEDVTEITASADICNTQRNIPGGWKKFEATPDVQKAMAFVLKEMDMISSFKQIVNVHAQIVSGVNYAIEFEMDDSSVWHTIVYRNLDGNYAVTQQPQKGTFCEN